KDLDTGADLPFAFEEHGTYGRPTLYEYRPLVRGFIEARADRLFARDDVREAVSDLQREPAARIFARAHEGVTRDEPRALYRSVLVPLLVRTAEGCGGFDWDDTAFNRAYAELEDALYGSGHSYGAVAPLVGISCGAQLGLADDDPKLGDALDRWELALFQDNPFQSEQLKQALDAALGDGEGAYAASMRAAALLGETAEERAGLVESFRVPTSDLVRRL